MCKWYVETIFLVKLEAEQNMVFQNYVLAIQQIVESHIRTKNAKPYTLCQYVSIGAGPSDSASAAGNYSNLRLRPRLQ